MKFVRFFNILVILFLCSLLLACSGNGSPADSAAGGGRGGRGGGRGGRGARGAAGAPVQVQMAKVSRIAIQRQVDLTGTLVSINQARVTTEVPGVVNEVLFELGSEVRAGQTLARLDTRELDLALQRAESALRQTEAQLGLDPGKGMQMPPDEEVAAVRTAMANRDDARAQLNRARELVSKGLMPRVEADTIETRLKVTEAAYQAAVENVRALRASIQDRRASVELARKKLADAIVKAPIDGAISDRPVQRGEYIRENSPVATIVQTSPLKLVAAVQEKFSNSIRPNMVVQFEVESLPNEKFEGRIVAISPSVDQTSRTFPVEILVDNSRRKLKPGFFAKGVILTELDTDVMAVPDQAIMSLAGVSSVYVIKDGVVQQRNIKIGTRQENLVEVTAGLTGDEILAASNLNELAGGSRVSTGTEGGGGRGEARGAPGGEGRGGTPAESKPAEGAAQPQPGSGGDGEGRGQGGRRGQRGQRRGGGQ